MHRRLLLIGEIPHAPCRLAVRSWCFPFLHRVLPEPLPPPGAYVPVVVANGIVYMAGRGAIQPGGAAPAVTGRVTSERSIEEGYEAARLSTLSALASFRAELGNLDLFAKENGLHARSAVGMAALQRNITVELDSTFELVD